MPRPVPMPTPDMPRRPDGREFMPVPLPRDFEPNYERMPLPLDYEPKYTPMMYGGMASKRGLVDGPGGYSGDERGYLGTPVGGVTTMTDLVKGAIGDEDPEDDEETKKRQT